jgi:hypothetical protein
MIITEQVYLEMKKYCAEYESGNTDQTEQPYIEELIIDTERKYNPKYGDDRICKCGDPYYRHFDTY